jgi:DNA-binding NarL/FixJ family response regulator
VTDRLRLLYIDDDPLALDALAALLSDVDDVGLEAIHVDQADAVSCEAGEPCVILIELFLFRNGEDGIGMAKRFAESQPGVPVALCTASESAVDAAKAWDAGIRAFLTKRELLRRGARLSSVLRAVWDGSVVYDIDPRRAAATNPLTARELEILQRKVDGQRHRRIADDLCLSVRTIDSHLANARSKLGADSLPHALEVAARLGLIRTRAPLPLRGAPDPPRPPRPPASVTHP